MTTTNDEQAQPAPLTKRVYVMDNRSLTEEQIAVAFAMTSRNPEPFDEIAQEVTKARAAGFSKRWVIGYGHSSVAEHAVLHLAVENVSRLACDTILSNRLASYTEKSSRYQVITPNAFHVPTELTDTPSLRAEYVDTCHSLMLHYSNLIEQLQQHLNINYDQQAGETDNAYALRLRRAATDAARSLLPAATLTNIAITINARSLEHAISKLLSGRLQEEREIGDELLTTGKAVTPTLLRHAGRNDWLTPSAPYPGGVNASTTSRNTPATLVKHDPDAIRDLVAAFLLRRNPDYNEAQRVAAAMNDTEQFELLDGMLAGMARYDSPPREFELVHYTFQLAMDYGALREFRRHRMQTVISPPLTIQHGYDIDPLIVGAGLADAVKETIGRLGQAHGRIAEHSPSVAQYLVTHAHRQLILCDLNLRECYHLFQLRTSPNAHRAIREPVMAMMAEIERVHPKILKWLQR